MKKETMYTLDAMAHVESLKGAVPITTSTRRDFLRRFVVLGTAVGIAAIATHPNPNVDSDISRPSNPTVPTPPTFTDRLTVEKVDLFNGGSLPVGMTTSIQTPGTASPQNTESPQIVK